MEEYDFTQFNFFQPWYGIECDDGWYSIIYELCQEIDKLVKTSDNYEDFQIVQVKQKFGELRVYTNYITNEIDEIIEKAKKKAITTCEICGQPGNLCTNNGWWRSVRCKEHIEKNIDTK